MENDRPQDYGYRPPCTVIYQTLQFFSGRVCVCVCVCVGGGGEGAGWELPHKKG